MGIILKVSVATAAAVLVLSPIDAFAVKNKCKNGVCGRTTFDGSRVTIYFGVDGPSLPISHWNFKGNNSQGITGSQIELRQPYYSFNARKGQSGKYFLQACGTKPIGGSRCTRWADFSWEARKK
jgi:hypothetical protein